MAPRYTIQAMIYPGDELGYVAECLNLAVVTQGQTLNQTVHNLREAIQLYLEGEDLVELGLVDHPLDTGTLRAIFRQASQYIAEQALRPHFYSE